MKKFVTCFENGVVYEEEFYNTKEEALREAEYYWNHLTTGEKKKVTCFDVYEIEASEEEMEKIEEGELSSCEYWVETVEVFV